MEFIVAVKGDFDGDGVLKVLDLAKANMELLADHDIDPVKALIMGVSNGGSLKVVDLAKLNLSMINNSLSW